MNNFLRCCKKKEEDRATGVNIVPQFTAQPTLSRRIRIVTENPLILPKTNTSLYFLYRRKKTPTMLNVTLMACLVSGSP